MFYILKKVTVRFLCQYNVPIIGQGPNKWVTEFYRLHSCLSVERVALR